jgi:putative ABC transport system permease protein
MGRQLDFIKNKDLGFNKEEVVIIALPEEDDAINDKGFQFREYIRNIAVIEKASLIGGGALPGEENGKDLFEVNLEGLKTEKIFNIHRIDEQYFDLLDIKLASGRNFNADNLSDKTWSVIINESLAKSLKWDKPLGKKIWYDGESREVIGVVKNFHNKSLHNIIEPWNCNK